MSALDNVHYDFRHHYKWLLKIVHYVRV